MPVRPTVCDICRKSQELERDSACHIRSRSLACVGNTLTSWLSSDQFRRIERLGTEGGITTGVAVISMSGVELKGEPVCSRTMINIK